VENQNQVSPFPTAARDDDHCSPTQSPKTTKGHRPLPGLPFIHFQDHHVLETEPGFRIILRLENAKFSVAQVRFGSSATQTEGNVPQTDKERQVCVQRRLA
jgi:hypothetical protein